jgi:hypothetical protein
MVPQNYKTFEIYYKLEDGGNGCRVIQAADEDSAILKLKMYLPTVIRILKIEYKKY